MLHLKCQAWWFDLRLGIGKGVLKLNYVLKISVKFRVVNWDSREYFCKTEY